MDASTIKPGTMVWLKRMQGGRVGNGPTAHLLPMLVTHVDSERHTVDGVLFTARPGAIGQRSPAVDVVNIPFGDGPNQWQPMVNAADKAATRRPRKPNAEVAPADPPADKPDALNLRPAEDAGDGADT